MGLIITNINIERQVVVYINRSSKEKKRNVRLHLPSRQAHNDTDICQEARYAPMKLAAATVLF